MWARIHIRIFDVNKNKNFDYCHVPVLSESTAMVVDIPKQSFMSMCKSKSGNITYCLNWDTFTNENVHY